MANRNVYNTIYSGTKQISTSAQKISSTSIQARQGVTVLASSGNVGSIYVGNSGVTATGGNEGFPLKGNLGVTLPIDDVSNIWVVGQNTTDRVHWTLV